MTISNELIYYILNDYYSEINGYNRDWVDLRGYDFKDDYIEINFMDKMNDIKSSYLLSYEKYESLRNEYFNKKINKIKSIWKQN